MSKQARQVQNLILLGKLAFPIRFQKERSSICGLEVESLLYNDQATFYHSAISSDPVEVYRWVEWGGSSEPHWTETAQWPSPGSRRLCLELSVWRQTRHQSRLEGEKMARKDVGGPPTCPAKFELNYHYQPANVSLFPVLDELPILFLSRKLRGKA